MWWERRWVAAMARNPRWHARGTWRRTNPARVFVFCSNIVIEIHGFYLACLIDQVFAFFFSRFYRAGSQLDTNKKAMTIQVTSSLRRDFLSVFWFVSKFPVGSLIGNLETSTLDGIGADLVGFLDFMVSPSQLILGFWICPYPSINKVFVD